MKNLFAVLTIILTVALLWEYIAAFFVWILLFGISTVMLFGMFGGEILRRFSK